MKFFSVLLLPLFFMVNLQAANLNTLRETGQAFSSIAKRCSPAVVFIKVEKKLSNAPVYQGIPPEFFRHFFGNPQQFQPQQSPIQIGQGTGFIISQDGYILTNNHVVSGADKILVTLNDAQELNATVVGADKHSDVAVIKIKKTGLPFLKLGDSDVLQVGEWVVAVGNPFGLSHTITAGIVSAKGRSSVGLTDYENFIQTDAAINPGNSGGPLINLDGKVVGINTAIYSRNGGYMGIGFAIPINMAKLIKNQLIDHGSVNRAYLGVLIQNITPDLADGFSLKINKGVLISNVQDNSPAKKAGLKRGDIVIKLNGKKVDKVATFRNHIALMPPKTKINLTVIRDTKKININVTLGALSGADSIVSIQSELSRFGFDVKDAKHGVVISKVISGSIAERVGLKVGMVILEVQRQDVDSVKSFKNIISKLKKDSPLMLLVGEGNSYHYVVMR